MKSLLSLAVLCGTVLALVSSRPAPVGPGAVYHAVRDVCAALDRGATEELAALLQDGGEGVCFRPEDDGGLAVAQDTDGIPMFAEVGRDGATRAADDVRGFLALLDDEADAGWSVRTRVVSILADCSSERASLGVAVLERVHEKPGEAPRTQRLQLSVLLSRTSGPFRVWHWHASPIAVPGTAPSEAR